MEYQCEFCTAVFQPRPQVKNPRACSNCQKQRQRLNEQEWRAKNSHLSSGDYHRIYREQRLKKITLFVETLIQAMNVGLQFYDFNFDKNLAPHLNLVMIKFLSHLGLRQISKFWPNYFNMDFRRLAEIQNINKLQTS
jgi:hypothetical protein